MKTMTSALNQIDQFGQSIYLFWVSRGGSSMLSGQQVLGLYIARRLVVIFKKQLYVIFYENDIIGQWNDDNLNRSDGPACVGFNGYQEYPLYYITGYGRIRRADNNKNYVIKGSS